MTAPFLEFHTHATGCNKYTDTPDVLVIQSLHLGETPHPRADFLTIGIHPMLQGARDFIRQPRPYEAFAAWHQQLTQMGTPIIGIGECGWDQRAPLTLEEQGQLVALHISLAEQWQLPLIFHIVGGWHHILAAHKRLSHSEAATPWIIHGFRGKQALADQLQSAGIYLSLHPYCPTLQLDQHILETDDTPGTIQEHYEARHLADESCRNKIIKFFCNLFTIDSRNNNVSL